MFSFLTVRSLPKIKVEPAPHRSFRRVWVKILADDRVGYIDHFKWDGKFGVRPVRFQTGEHYPNPSEHWTEAQRLAHPEELALSLEQFRAATQAEIPAQFRVEK